jgi:hypothetical protein
MLAHGVDVNSKSEGWWPPPYYHRDRVKRSHEYKPGIEPVGERSTMALFHHIVNHHHRYATSHHNSKLASSSPTATVPPLSSNNSTDKPMPKCDISNMNEWTLGGVSIVSQMQIRTGPQPLESMASDNDELSRPWRKKPKKRHSQIFTSEPPVAAGYTPLHW